MTLLKYLLSLEKPAILKSMFVKEVLNDSIDCALVSSIGHASTNVNASEEILECFFRILLYIFIKEYWCLSDADADISCRPWIWSVKADSTILLSL